eukprot:2342544-Pleurochrysis_carterae.AAC.1
MREAWQPPVAVLPSPFSQRGVLAGRPTDATRHDHAARSKKAQREAQGMGDSVQEWQPSMSAPVLDASL